MTLKKNTLPGHIDILGTKFRVELVERVDEEDSCGETDGELRFIRICSSQDTRRRWTTLFHEFVHGVLHVVGLGNKLEENTEEVIAQSMEHAVEQFMMKHGNQYLKALEAQSEDI